MNALYVFLILIFSVNAYLETSVSEGDREELCYQLLVEKQHTLFVLDHVLPLRVHRIHFHAGAPEAGVGAG